MDFAKEQLSKHGWTEGQGLGKTESGITEAIKVKIKQNKTGVGHDPGEEFTFHWWDHVFNKAASNIKVKTTENGVEIKNKADTLVTKKKNTYCNKNMLYGQFVKGATLSDGTETKDKLNVESSEDEEPAETTQCLMPDQAETVFKMCGGRTAHKGARHGLKLNGKLQRIEEQERLLLESYKSSKKISVDMSDGDKNLNNDTSEVETVIKKKAKKEKKRKRKLEKENDDVKEEVTEIGKDSNEHDEDLLVNNEHVENVKSKKKSKKRRDIEADNEDTTNMVNDVNVSDLTCENSSVTSCDKKRKKNKKRRRDIE